MKNEPLNYAKVKQEYESFCMDQKQFKSFLRFAPKGKHLRYVGRVPLAAATIHPEVCKYLSPLADKESSKKDQDLLFSKFPEFDLRERSNHQIIVPGFSK